MNQYQPTRRVLLRGAAGTVIALALPTGPAAAATTDEASGFAFAHPGLLHRQADLDRMREAVAAGEEPVASGFAAMAAHARSSADYRVRNTGQVTSWGRGPTDHTAEAADDADAAYQNALMWAATGDARHADKARDILDAWSASLQTITGADGQLGAGLQGFKLVNAAEILRHTGYTGWTEAAIARCEDSFKAVWYPSVSGYALFANGNWDVAALQTVIAVAVFCDDRVMFEDAVRCAVAGPGNGSITGIVVDEGGQGQESGRSQAYAQLALGLLSDVAEVAWNQGVDLYGHSGNRILAGFEYVSRYNLGEDVPFTPDLDRTGKYLKTAVAAGNRGQWRPIHEMAYGHYKSRMGLDMPWTEQVVFRGADGARHVEGVNDDHPSWGTLTFARPAAAPGAPASPPPAPAGLAATAADGAVTVSWAAAVDPDALAYAERYTVKRGASDSDLTVIATDLTSTSYTDSDVEPGRTYVYAVAAANGEGTGPDSLGIAVAAGLPGPWSYADVGGARPAGAAAFDGQAFRIEAGGSDIAGTRDRFGLTYLPMTGDGTLTARIVHPVSSQYAKLGVTMRESLEDDSAHASMLVQGLPLHAWSGVWTTRARTGRGTEATGAEPVPPSQQTAITTDAGFPISNLGSLPSSATPLPFPCIEAASDGYRWRRPHWVRLERNGCTFTGSISPDGREWTEVGSTELDLDRELLIGLAVCSVLGVEEDWAETTTAAFDNVTAPGWSAPAPAAPPLGLRARTGESAVHLAWTSPDASARYTVERSGPGGETATVAEDVGPVGFGVETRWADATGAPGSEYRYTVRALNASGTGPASAPAAAVMPSPPVPEFTGRTEAYADTGAAFRYAIRASSHPTAYTATGLPEGLALDPATGLVTGVPAETGEFAVGLTAANVAGAAEATLALTVGAPPPAPWGHRDIGDPVADEQPLGTRGVAAILEPGGAAYEEDTGAFTVRGSGGGLNLINQGMTVHYAFAPLEGDGTVLARLAEWDGAASGGAAGLVIAKSLSPFDQVAAAVLGGDGTARFFRRPRVAAAPAVTDGPVAAAPIWLRLTREGDAFAAASSPDGQDWTPIGEPSPIPTFGDATYRIGLAVTSGDPTELSTAVFDQVAVTPWFPAQTVAATARRYFEHRIATATAAAFTAEGLPRGLAIDPDTGLISGTPRTPGNYTVTVTAANAAGTRTAAVTLAVDRGGRA
ncbi:putative Ig domain-containing protein [Glycomyces sp. MUSA5-2]|uniref:putative Ig domain-containing protein n=1 Tax=Glycomyces sp. MUSA5-2 TaxID=2053002 RepID=UPI0030087BEB